MSETWHSSLDGTWNTVWEVLDQGQRDRAAPARHPVLATVGLDGGGEARIVVLRVADAEMRVLAVHTDLSSNKVSELRRVPDATLLVWDAGRALQIRLRVRVRILSGHDVATEWEQVPQAARGNYGGPSPGMRVDGPVPTDAGGDAARFAVMECAIGEIETLHLGADAHARARFVAEDGFAGAWIAP